MRLFLFISSVSGFFSVALGAFAAHALKKHLDDYFLGVFKTGVEYQFFHSFALALAAILLGKVDLAAFRWSGYCFAGGIVIFSGSLYLLSLTQVRAWGAVTPIGGVLFLVGWALLVVGVRQMP